jgi:hypothetical protein
MVKEEGGVGEETKTPEINPRVLVEIWNSDCGPLPKIEKLTDSRKTKAKSQLANYPDLGHWREVLTKWKISEFCRDDWRPTFDDWLSESKRIRTIEGAYDNRKRPAASGIVER